MRLLLSDETNGDESDSVPVPDCPGAPVFPEVVPVPHPDTSEDKYMEDVMDALNKEGMFQFSFNTIVIISTVMYFTHLILQMFLQMMVKKTDQLLHRRRWRRMSPTLIQGPGPLQQMSPTPVTDIVQMSLFWQKQSTSKEQWLLHQVTKCIKFLIVSFFHTSQDTCVLSVLQ